MRRLWIARHGNRWDFVEPAWFLSADRPYDPPLSTDGHLQAAALAQCLAGETITHLICSPFLRAIQTAVPIAEGLGLPIHLEPGLGEWRNPQWFPAEPVLTDAAMVRSQYGAIAPPRAPRVQPRYPETRSVMHQRIAQTLEILWAEYGGDLLIVGHGATVEGILETLTPGLCPPKAPLCCLSELHQTPQGWQGIRICDTQHLAGVPLVSPPDRWS